MRRVPGAVAANLSRGHAQAGRSLLASRALAQPQSLAQATSLGWRALAARRTLLPASSRSLATVPPTEGSTPTEGATPTPTPTPTATSAADEVKADEEPKPVEEESKAAEEPEPEPEAEEVLVKREANADEKHEFKAETAKLLDIVINSIYTDKEIFLRELVSNAADALEKFRHVSTAGGEVADGDRALEVHIRTSDAHGTLTIQDSGIGMTKAEMLENLGTIARSGSKAFVDAQDSPDTDAAKNVIGQFGVGFYAAFMVAKEVHVYSRSSTAGEPAHVWKSGGSEDFSLQEAPDFTEAGTRIVLVLKDDQKAEYTDPARIRDVVKRYSNYVGYPVLVNEEKANEMSALWTRDKREVSEEEYTEFYRFCAKAYDKPRMHLHLRTDVPIDLKAVLFVPQFHTEKHGMGRMESGVSLYSRKVLLEHESDNMLPPWMRFVKGVVDSEDLPISLSRETSQDTRLLATIKKALTKQVIKMIADKAKKDKAAYEEFYAEFGNFIKEGICTDFDTQADLAKLLRYSSSQTSGKEVTSLDEYVSRCKPSQKSIYYLSAPTRELALASPYYEVFKKKKVEVLFLYNTIDDFVMSNLVTFQDKKLVAAETGDLDELSAGDVDDMDAKDKKAGEAEAEAEAAAQAELPKAEAEAMLDWLKSSLDDVVHKVSPSTRLHDTPAVIVDHESAALRRMMKMVQQASGEGDSGAGDPTLPKQHFEVNVSHPIIHSINDLRKSNPALADSVARQLYDNSLVAAGLIEDPRTMLPRLNKLIAALLQVKNVPGVAVAEDQATGEKLAVDDDLDDLPDLVDVADDKSKEEDEKK